MISGRALAAVAALAAAGAGGALAARAAAVPAVTYSAAQAWNGRLDYDEHCAECHGGDLGGQFGPALAGPDSRLQWESGQYVYGYMTVHMPHGDPGALAASDYVDIMAFLYQQHHKTAGAAPLSARAANADTAPMGS